MKTTNVQCQINFFLFHQLLVHLCFYPSTEYFFFFFAEIYFLHIFSDPIVKEQGRMSTMSGHTSPTPVTNTGQIGGRQNSPLTLNSYLEHV